jgi:hypothetical protein
MKKMVGGKGKVMSLTLLVAFLNTAYAGGYYYNDQAVLVKQIDGVLISNKLCSDENDCTIKKILFVGGQKERIEVSIYGLNSRHQKILAEITNICSMVFYKNNGQIDIKLTVTDSTKQESLDLWFWQRKNVYEVNFMGVK